MSPLLENETTCSKCGFSTEKSRDAQILYTTCCGVTFCSECMNAQFRSRRSISCPSCSVALLRSSFDERPYPQQKYDSLSKHRKLTNSVFHVVTRDDFPSDKAYSDHLEMVENVLYDLTYGDPKEVEEAQRAIEKFKATYSERLTAQMSAKIAAQTIANDRASAPSEESNIPTEQAAVIEEHQGPFPVPVLFNTLPKMIMAPADSLANVDTLKMSPAELKKHKYAVFLKKVAAATAGGFRKGVAEARYRQDAFNGLFDFL